MNQVNITGRRVGLSLGTVVLLVLVMFLVLRPNRGLLLSSPPAPSTTTSTVVADIEKPVTATIRQPVPDPSPLVSTVGEASAAGQSATVLGRVIDHESELPIAQARIGCVPRTNDSLQADVLAVSDADGCFQIDTPSDGVRTLRVEADGYPVYWTPNLQLPFPGMNNDGTTKLDLGEIRLQHGVRPVVRVSDASGKTCAGANLYLFGGSELGSRYLPRFLGVTDIRGEWAAAQGLTEDIEALHFLATTDSGWGWTPLALVSSGSQADPLEVRLRPSGGIAFHVQDGEGNPIANAEVVLRSQSYPIGSISWHDSPIGVGSSTPFRARLATRTDDRGDARIDNLPSDGGKIEWSAYIDGANWRSEKIKGLHAVGNEPQRVVLKRDVLVHAVTGKVLDRAGHPVESAIVRCGKIGCRPDKATGQYRIELPGTPPSNLGQLDAQAVGY